MITQAMTRRVCPRALSQRLFLLCCSLFAHISAVASLLLLVVASTCMVGANIMLVNLMPICFGAVAGSFGWASAIWVWVVFSLLALLTALMGCGRWGRYARSAFARVRIFPLCDPYDQQTGFASFHDTL